MVYLLLYIMKKEDSMKTTIIVLLILFTISVSSELYYLQHDDGDVYSEISMLKWAGANYRAVKYYAEESCTVMTLSWGRETRNIETDTVFIWPNKLDGGGPDIDNPIYKSDMLIGSGGPHMITHTLYMPITVSDLFWIGIYARTSDRQADKSLVLSDTMALGIGSDARSWYYNTTDWIPLYDQITGKTGDYMIRGTVTGPTDILVKLDTENIEINEYEDTYSDIFTYNSLSGIINIDRACTFSIYDITGRLLMNRSVFPGDLIELDYSDGVYFAIGKNGNDRKIIKLIISVL